MAIITKKLKAGTRYYVAISEKGADGQHRMVYQPGGYATKRDAQVEERRLLGERDNGVATLPTRVTFAEYAQEWLDSKKGMITESTRRDYASYLNLYALPALGTLRLTAVTPEAIEGLYSGLRSAGLSEVVVRHVHVTLSQIFKRAVRLRRLGRNPVELVHPPSVRMRRPETPSAQAMAELLARIPSTALGAAMKLVIYTGLRRGEVCGLQWADVDLDAGTIAVRRSVARDGTVKLPKTRAGERTIAIGGGAVAMLRVLRNSKNRGLWVFEGRRGPYTPSALSHAFAKLKAGRLHDLRHTHASLLLSQGIELPLVSARLGHASTAITAAIYSHAVPGRDRHAAENFEGILRKFLERAPEEAAK